MDIKTILALVLSTMISIRMTFWLINPEKHKGLVVGLYSANRVWAKRIVYFGLFLYLSYLIISQGTIVDFVIALFAIGALFDFFFTFFRYPKNINEKFNKDIKYGSIEIPALTPVRYYIAVPLILITVWLYTFVLNT